MTASAQITALLLEQGCEIPDIPILQPAEPFLETIGEDIRRRMFTTSGDDGVEMCLRPEFTIPICLHWLAGDNRSAGRFGYFGPVFRRQRRTSNEFQQAGVEDFGAPDSLAADARMAISDYVESTFGSEALTSTVNGLFEETRSGLLTVGI